MKVNYNRILNTYAQNILSIDQCLIMPSYIAIEAEENVENATKDTDINDNALVSKVTSIGDTIKKLIENFISIVNKWAMTIANKLKLIMQTDKGYEKALTNRMRMVKPLTGTKVLNFTYNIRFLETVYNNLSREFSNKMTKISNTLNSLDITDVDSVNTECGLDSLIQAGFKNKDLKTGKDFLTFIQKEFRGEKKEITYTQAQLPQIIQLSRKTSEIKVKCDKALNESKKHLNTVKAMQNRVKYKLTDAEQVKKFSTLLKTAIKLRSFYNSFISWYMELRTEQSLAYRNIVKKFYQF